MADPYDAYQTAFAGQPTTQAPPIFPVGNTQLPPPVHNASPYGYFNRPTSAAVNSDTGSNTSHTLHRRTTSSTSGAVGGSFHVGLTSAAVAAVPSVARVNVSSASASRQRNEPAAAAVKRSPDRDVAYASYASGAPSYPHMSGGALPMVGNYPNEGIHFASATPTPQPLPPAPAQSPSFMPYNAPPNAPLAAQQMLQESSPHSPGVGMAYPAPSSPPRGGPPSFLSGIVRSLSAIVLGEEAVDPASARSGGHAVPPPIYQTRFGHPADDLPLLDELGIHPQRIVRRAMLLLNPIRKVPEEAVKDTDLAGPLLIAITLAALLSLRGRMTFGDIYGLSVFGVLLFKGLLTLMNEKGSGVSMQFIISCLGYALLPHLFLASLRATQHWVAHTGSAPTMLFIPALLVVAWSSWCATSLLVKGTAMEAQRYLILYPVFLFYSVFAALTVF